MSKSTLNFLAQFRSNNFQFRVIHPGSNGVLCENKTKIASRIGIDRTSNLDPLIFSNPAQATIKIYPLRSMYCYYTINSTVLSSALSVFRFP